MSSISETARRDEVGACAARRAALWSAAMRRADLARVVARALRELDPARRVREALPPRPPRGLPARIVAIGKAAPAMAAGALARWGSAVERCLVVAPDGTELGPLVRAASRAGVASRVVVSRASHPLPDRRSVQAGRACLAEVATEAPRAILVLVSGGASALACVPAPGVTLAKKRAITRALLASGATVQELNTVRKHLSRLKGGGLLGAAAPNEVLTLVASDVLGGSASDVGSGPSVLDATTRREARDVLCRYAPRFADVPLAATLGADARTSRVRTLAAARSPASIVVSSEELAQRMVRLLCARGLDARLLRPSQGPAEALAAEYGALVRAYFTGRRARAGGSSAARAFVRAAEPSVVVPTGAGRGGRSCHLAALVGRELDGARALGRRATFAAFATDGIDSSSGAAGAIVDERFRARVQARLGPRALDEALARFDTGTLHRAMGTALPSRPSGHNLADLHVLVLR